MRRAWVSIAARPLPQLNVEQPEVQDQASQIPGSEDLGASQHLPYLLESARLVGDADAIRCPFLQQQSLHLAGLEDSVTALRGIAQRQQRHPKVKAQRGVTGELP